MDEEEQKRQAASAAFAQAAFSDAEQQRLASADRKREREGDRRAIAKFTERWGDDMIMDANDLEWDQEDRITEQKNAEARAAWGEMQTPEGGTRYPFVDNATGRTIPAESAVPPAAASAFSQLDAPAPGPLDYDPATAAGLPQETQDAFRRNWDDNLAAARNAIEGNGPGKEERDALAIYTDQLVRMADDYQNNRRAAQAQPQVNADPYAAQRQREAAVGKRMAEYDVFSSPTATTTLFTPDTARTNTYDRIMRDKSGKEVFDYFM